MNPNCVTAPIDGQTLALRMAAEAVEKGDLAAEQFLRMLTVEVGHTDSEVVYAENTLELHRYEPAELRHETPILIVYALVNRPYILDLQPDRSVIRRLLAAGFRVYLIDWGEPSRLDATLGMADYVCRYLDNCVDATRADAGVDDLHLLGYCMGGTMSLLYASRTQDPIRSLTCMATPVAFDGNGGILEHWAEYFDPAVAVDTFGNVPADALALEFSMMDPIEHYVTKYVRLYENLDDPAFVENFARMERWIWDGVDVAGRAFEEFVGELYRENRLVRGEFTLAGEPVDLSSIDVPLCQIVGEYDHIVPAESSRPLNDLVASADERFIEFPAGHIGISVSSAAHERLWPDVANWLAARSDPATGDGEREDARESARPPTAVDESDAPTADQDSDRERARQTVRSVARRAADRLTDADARDEDLPDDAGADDREQARRTVDSVARRAAGQIRGDRPSADSRSAPDGDESTPVDAIDGIGPTYARRLREAGIETVAALGRHEPEEIADAVDAPRGRVENWLDRTN